MGSTSSDDGFDQLSDRIETYCFSADISESESSCCHSRRHFDLDGGSSSLTSSPEPEFIESANFTEPVPVMLPVVAGRHVIYPEREKEVPETELSEVELMKERFAKLLLGEDMSGGGNGVCTALAISNAITNLSATVFGELWKLQPLAPQKKLMWRREMDWLLCVSDYIVELIPSSQEFPGGGTFEVMVTRPRADLHINLPALKKLDAMLLSILEGFRESDFRYVDHGVVVAETDEGEGFPSSSSGMSRPSVRQEEKWWLPFPKVPPHGLCEETRKRLLQCRECTSQILKAAMAINNNVLAEMEIPNSYIETLPKSGKECLGDIIHRYITAEHFSPECLLDYLDLSSEYTTLEIANRIEAAVHIWRQKYQKWHSVSSKGGKSSWGGKVKGFVGEIEKTKVLANRAETLLHNLKLRFPGLPQTALDMSKIQHNKDVGKSILESYSRVMESLAFNILARIDDLLYVDDATKQRVASQTTMHNRGRFSAHLSKEKEISPSSFSIHLSPSTSTSSNGKIGSPDHGKPRPRRSFTSTSQVNRLEKSLERLAM